MSDQDNNIVPFAPAGAGGSPANKAADEPAGASSTSSSSAGAAVAVGPPADPAEAFETKAGLEEYHFEDLSGKFWLRNEAGEWVSLNETGFKRHLKKRGLKDKANVQGGEVISQVDEVVRDVEQNRRVGYAGLLAGYRAGEHVVTGRRVLVTEDPVYITPAAGDWPVLRAFFDGLLVGQEPSDDNGGFVTIDQRDHFFGWLQHAVQSYYDARITTGLAVGIAGEPDCGKSFLAWVMRQIFGGRVGKPYAAMTGQDNFNRDSAEAVLQLVDDENQADTRLDMRQKFASEIKKFVANNEFRLRSMHKDGFSVEVLRRLFIIVNLQGILVLPPLDGDVDDKLDLFKGYARPLPAGDRATWKGGRPTLETPYDQACWPAPMPTRTEEERAAYRAAVLAELPAFLWWLLREFKLPSHVSGGRFVVRHWHHPAIVAELHDMSPHTRLWDLIVRSKCVFWRDTGGGGPDDPIVSVERAEWRGSASELEDLLRNDTRSKLSQDEKREIKAANWLGKRLALCEKHLGGQFCRLEVSRLKKTWVLRPRPQDVGEAK